MNLRAGEGSGGLIELSAAAGDWSSHFGAFTETTKPPWLPTGVLIKPAITYFRVIHTIMGPKCLTAVFGMGTGVATWVWSPASRFAY